MGDHRQVDQKQRELEADRWRLNDFEVSARENEIRDLRASPMSPPPRAMAPRQPDGSVFLALVVVAGICLFLTVALTVRMWMYVDGALRTILENSPLSGSVATAPPETLIPGLSRSAASQAADSGSPVVVLIVLSVLVLAALVAISIWRRRIVGRLQYGETSWLAVFGVTVLRSFVLFGGVSLTIVCASIAAGNDLESNGPNGDPNLQFLLLALIGFSIFTYFSYVRSLNRG